MIPTFAANSNTWLKSNLPKITKCICGFGRALPSRNVIFGFIASRVFHLLVAVWFPFTPINLGNAFLYDWPHFKALESRFPQFSKELTGGNNVPAGLGDWRNEGTCTTQFDFAGF